MKRHILYKRAFVSVLLILSVIFITLIGRRNSSGDTSPKFAEAEKGRFEITVSSTGELVAENSIELKGPSLPSSGTRHRHGRRIRGTSVKILDLVPEGTMVKKGDYVAQLDRTNYENVLKDEQENLKTIRTSLEMKILDTAVVLTDLRNEIRNQVFAVELLPSQNMNLLQLSGRQRLNLTSRRET